MANKIRIYKLAKDLELDSKEIIKEAHKLGIEVKSHASTVTDEEAALITESFKELKKDSTQQVETVPETKKEKTESVETQDVPPAETQKKEADPVDEISKEKEDSYQATRDKFEGDLEEIERNDIRPRHPIVTVMGHVDHGKTQLLDTIRHTNVIARESGGITQHIGASKVDIKGKGSIVFIDTPGHEAFTAMRARGAQITDIVILVVAGDDGVMPQTIEAINHAKAAGVPVIVAINKMDLPDYDSERVLTQLSRHDILTEAWGGDVISVQVSAKENKNIDELLDMVILQTEMLELKAPYDGPAKGIIIEAELDKRVGPTATLIVTEGILNTGDSFICGTSPGKIKALIDDSGNRIDKAEPSTPVRILGFEDVPQTADIFHVVIDRAMARDIAKKRRLLLGKEDIYPPKKVTLEDLRRQLLGQENKELRIILKTDVAGSLEAIRETLLKFNHEEVSLNIIHSGVGIVTKKDIMLASASNAIIVGFNISAPESIKKEAENEGIQLRTYRIIYEIIDDIKKSLEGMLVPEENEINIGQAEIKKIYVISGVGTIAGCSVVTGLIKRKAPVRVLRDSKIVYVGNLAALKRFKNDASEVNQGYECGINVEGFNDIKVGDIIESFEIEQTKRTIDGSL
ncbi:MAG: translation initiation factor IF-2 [Elusimicrobiota bacterium]